LVEQSKVVPTATWDHIRFWGSFESLGVNASKSLDFEKITVLLVTNHVSNIDDVVEVVNADLLSDVRIIEIGLYDESMVSSKMVEKDGIRDGPEKKFVEEEALMAMCFENEKLDVNVNGNRIDSSSSIYGNVESQNVDHAVKNIGSEKVNRREFSNIKMDPLWTNVVGSLGDEGQDIGIQPVYDQMTKRVLEDISNMGLVVEGVLNPISKEHILGCNREEEIIDMVENERNLSWVAEVDRANGTCDAEDHYFGEGYEEM
ncbi:hypothetical protein V6N11_083888, partial [Hibiscus sabdariffa]